MNKVVVEKNISIQSDSGSQSRRVVKVRCLKCGWSEVRDVFSFVCPSCMGSNFSISESIDLS